MHLKFKILVCFIFIVFISCSISVKVTENKIKKMSWLCGKWENIEDDVYFTEIWDKVNDNMLKGYSFMTINLDTLYFAKMYILNKGNKIYYIDTIEGQKEIIPNNLILVRQSDNKICFKGLKNSPTVKLLYLLNDANNSLTIKSYSIIEDSKKINEEKFIMTKVPY